MRMYENKRFRIHEGRQNLTDSTHARKAIRLKLYPNCKQCTVFCTQLSVHIRCCKMRFITLSLWSVFLSVFREKLTSVFAVVPTILLSVYASSRCVLLELLLCTRCFTSTHKFQQLLDPAIFGTNIPFKNSSVKKIPQMTGLLYCPGRTIHSDSVLNPTFLSHRSSANVQNYTIMDQYVSTLTITTNM
jgi:Pyruvate/2-oxoacid:ferredoxin oxidoreductase delta subunit